MRHFCCDIVLTKTTEEGVSLTLQYLVSVRRLGEVKAGLKQLVTS